MKFSGVALWMYVANAFEQWSSWLIVTKVFHRSVVLMSHSM